MSQIGKIGTYPHILNNEGKIDRNRLRFDEILTHQLEENSRCIRISAHAQQRLDQRNITLESEDLEALVRAMKESELKGGKESLIFYKDMAFIASVRNRTLITALDSEESNMKVFTNIDSAVLVK